MAEHNQGNYSNKQRRDQEEYNDQGQQQYGNSRYRGGQNQHSGYGGQFGGESQYGGSSFQGSNYGGGYSSGRGNFAGGYSGGYSGQNQQSNFGNEYNHGSDFNRDVDQHPEFNTWGGAAGVGVNRAAYDGGYNQYSGQQQYGQQNQNQYSDHLRRQRNSEYGQQEFGQQSYGNSNYGNQSQYRDRNRDNDRNRSNNNRTWWDRTTDEVASWFGDEEAERRRRQDENRTGRSQQSGPHKGKGPKGYRRSDERIREDISDRLSDDPYVDASDIDIEVKGAEVILSGTVDSRDAKRRAEDLVESISGITHVENRIRVTQKNFDFNRGGSDGSYDTSGRNTGSMG